MSRHPDFDDLVPTEGIAAEEERRLRRVHDLLVAAGPPPELPPELQMPAPERAATVLRLPRRRVGAALLLAAALAAAAFGGFALGHHGAAFDAWRGPIAMHGRAGASATLLIGHADAAGNWPVQLRVHGLPTLPRGGYYELVLTRGAVRGPECGAFVVDGATTVVTMNAPASLEEWSGWVIVRHLPGHPESAPVLGT